MRSEYLLLRFALFDAIAPKTALNLQLGAQSAIALPIQRCNALLDLLPFPGRCLELRNDCPKSRCLIVEEAAEFDVRGVRQLRRGLGSCGRLGKPLGLFRHIAQRLVLGGLPDLELRWIRGPMCPNQPVVVQTIFHEGAARVVELSHGFGQPDRSVPSDDESQRICIIGFEKRGKCARLGGAPKHVEFVQTDQGSPSELASSVFEKCRSAADVGPVDEDSLPISAEEPLGCRCPSHVSDLDQIAEDAGRHPSLSQRSTQVNGGWFQMHRSATAGMLLKAISQLLRLRLFVFRLPDKTSAGLVHPVQQGSIDRKKP